MFYDRDEARVAGGLDRPDPGVAEDARAALQRDADAVGVPVGPVPGVLTGAGRYCGLFGVVKLMVVRQTDCRGRWVPAPTRPQPTATELAELSALADGTLDPARRADVEARIAASPELTALYERERRVVDALHQARATERAPTALRASIEASRPSRAPRRSPALRRTRAAWPRALAAVVLALVLALPSGTPGAPSVSDAAALAARGPTQAAPAPDPGMPGAPLHQSVGDVYFPNWASTVRMDRDRGAHRHARRADRRDRLLPVERRHDRLHDRALRRRWPSRRRRRATGAAPSCARSS